MYLVFIFKSYFFGYWKWKLNTNTKSNKFFSGQSYKNWKWIQNTPLFAQIKQALCLASMPGSKEQNIAHGFRIINAPSSNNSQKKIKFISWCWYTKQRQQQKYFCKLHYLKMNAETTISFFYLIFMNTKLIKYNYNSNHRILHKLKWINICSSYI